MKITSEPTEQNLCINLTGEINKDYQFPSITLTAKTINEVIIDMSKLHFMTNEGTVCWYNWITTTLKDYKVIFSEIPFFLIEKFNTSPHLLPSSYEVKSFYMPYICNECSNLFSSLLQIGIDYYPNAPIPKFSEIECSSCKKKTAQLIPNHTRAVQFLPEYDLNRYSYFNVFQTTAVIVIDQYKQIKFANDYASTLTGISIKRLMKGSTIFCNVIELDDPEMFCNDNGINGKSYALRYREVHYKTKIKEGTVNASLRPDREALPNSPRWIIYLEDSSLEIELKNKYRKEHEGAKKLAIISATDEMTGLNNYRAFIDKFKTELALAKENNNWISLIILDIDHFKKFNDNYGHLQGDKVLKETASTLRNTIKNTDFAARYGGEEFAIILPATHPQGLASVLEKIRYSIEEMQVKNINDNSAPMLSVTCSLGGVAIHPSYLQNFMEFTDDNCKSFIKIADTNLYNSKERGRNKCTLSTQN